MKNILLRILCLSGFFCFSQEDFEGKVLYEISFEFLEGIKKYGITKEKFKEQLIKNNQFFDEITYFYKNDNYKIESSFKGKKQVQIYIGENNMIYFFQDDIVVGTDASYNSSLIQGLRTSEELLSTKENVNGIECSIIKFTNIDEVYYYYYKKDLIPKDYLLFCNHYKDNFNDFLEISGSLPLKIVKTVKNVMKITMKLKKYQRMELGSNYFTLPKLREHEDFSKYAKFYEKIYSIEN